MDIDTVFELPGIFKRFMKLMFCNIDIETVYGSDLNRTQIRTLFFLENHPGSSMSSISKKINLEKGSFTSVVDTLLGKGYVIRERDTEDRRKVLLSLSPEGKEKTHILKNKLSLYFAEQIRSLGKEKQNEMEKAVVSLRTILELLEENIRDEQK